MTVQAAKAATPPATQPRPIASAPSASPAPSPVPSASARQSVDLTIVAEMVFRNTGDESVSSGTATVSLHALPQSRDMALLSETISPSPTKVNVDAAGNRVADFDLTGIVPGAQLTVRQEYRVRVWGYGGEGTDGDVLSIHTSREYKIDSEAPEILQLAASLIAGKTTTEAKLAAIFQGTRDRLKYNLSSPARNRGALAALLAGSGVCEEYASLFVALARAGGIPSRVVIGYGRNAASVEKAWPTGTNNLSGYKHAWAEAYVPGYGWAAFDPTLGRAAIPGLAPRQIPAGILIAQTYRNRSLTTVYVGGRIVVNWHNTVSW